MAAEILMAALFGGGVLWLSRKKFQTREPDQNIFLPAGALLLLGGLLLRLLLAYYDQGFTTDIDTFKGWAAALERCGFSQVYKENMFLDYPPGYLYVLAVLEKLRQWLDLPAISRNFTLLIKLPAILADMACGAALLWLGRRKLGGTRALFLSAAYLFCPAILVNSAQWGQVDSVATAILLASVLLLYREWYIPSALLYGLSIACKPQMLIFAPLYLFFALKQRKFLKLALGVACAVGAVLLTALPFTENWDFLWLLQRYQSTLDYYNYYSVNAYNFWALIGWNWRGLPGGWQLQLLTFSAPVLATLLCGGLVFFSKRKEALFVCPALLMSVMYLFGIKMHERYLYPVFLFLLVAYLFLPNRRLLWAYGAAAFTNYLNVAYVLYLFAERGGNYDPNALPVRVLAALQAAALGYLFYALWNTCFRKPSPEEEEVALPPQKPKRIWAPPAPVNSRLTRWDLLAVAAVTLLYGTVAFWRLGDHRQTALTAWTPTEGESVVLRGEALCDEICYLPGIAPAGNGGSKAGVNFKVETSVDGLRWTEGPNLSEGGTYVFTWAHYRLESPATYVRLTALDGSSVLNETALKLQGKAAMSKLSASGPGGAVLTDEQDAAPLYTTYENSFYFDEIYHVRAAYENILGLDSYENTHPPLGKYIISLGIRLFGMNPFGWRFMGTFFGVLMLPVLYHLLKQLFGKTSLCAAATLWFAFDFMHFTQTRIATIDTYAVFFLLLMYDAMVVFLRRDPVRDPLPKLLVPLFFCGVFTGLGIASKWTAAYGALGLAALFFGKLLLTLRDRKAAGEDLRPLRNRTLILCAWCCLFFLAIPFGLYFLSFLPLTTLPHNAFGLWSSFWRYQSSMFYYHSQLQAEHFFASPWYEWPFVVRPIWYFSGDPVNAQGQYSTISALGNPLLWWSGIPALLCAGLLWFRERRTWAAVVLCGFLSVYLPWILVPRLTFIYHYFTAVPFLVIALAGVFCKLPETAAGSKPLRLGNKEVPLASLFLWVFTAAQLLLFIVFFPVLSGVPSDKAYINALRLFPTWYF